MDDMSKNSVIASEICECRTKADINACRIQFLESENERLIWLIQKLWLGQVALTLSIVTLCAVFVFHWLPAH